MHTKISFILKYQQHVLTLNLVTKFTVKVNAEHLYLNIQKQMCFKEQALLYVAHVMIFIYSH